MLCNALWLPVFQMDTLNGFIGGFVIILGILYTCLAIMVQADAAGDNLNLLEKIAIQGGFAIYSGWVTCATIINFTFVFKRAGHSEEDGADEQKIAIKFIIFSQLVFIVELYQYQNALCAAIFLWALFFIKKNIEIKAEREFNTQELPELKSVVTKLLFLHTAIVVGFVVYQNFLLKDEKAAESAPAPASE